MKTKTYNLQPTTSKGFTLIELLVVIAVMSALATVLIFLVNPAETSRKSRDSKRLSDMSVIQKAIDLTMADGVALPTTPSSGVSLTSTTLYGSFDVSKYLPTMTSDPSSSSKGLEIDGSGNCKNGTAIVTNYMFWSDATLNTYILRSRMESTANCDLVKKDGNNNATFELGTDPGLDAF